MTHKGSYRILKRGILKSSGSSMRGGTPRISKHAKRAVSFSDNLERIHFFDPKEAFKPAARGTGSLDFRITISQRKNVGT